MYTEISSLQMVWLSIFMTDLISFILAQRCLVEIGGFWADHRRLVKNESVPLNIQGELKAIEPLNSWNQTMNPQYTNKVDIWSMGCILYELATGTRAFQTDWAVISYLSSQKNKDVVLDNTFDAHSIEIITKHIVDMLQIKSSARPSASILSKEFTRECQLIQVNHPISQQLNSVSSSITLLELSDDTEQTQSIPQNHQVIVTEGDNSKPILPSHLIGVSLYSVAEKGDVEAVKMLLGANADVDAQDKVRKDGAASGGVGRAHGRGEGVAGRQRARRRAGRGRMDGAASGGVERAHGRGEGVAGRQRARRRAGQGRMDGAASGGVERAHGRGEAVAGRQRARRRAGRGRKDGAASGGVRTGTRTW